MGRQSLSLHDEQTWNIIWQEMRKDDVSRFVEAQDSWFGSYAQALREIEAGRKRGHWIWYIFPQLRGLGFSRMSEYYGISGRAEAEAYLAHPVLGARLREITAALLRHAGIKPEKILGDIDALKVKSCMTLFDCISPDDIFAQVLAAFYNNTRDPRSVLE